MAGVRNKPLAVRSLTTAGVTVLYTCPAGHNTIVKSVYASRESGTATALIVQLIRAGVALVTIFEDGSVEERAVHSGQVWVVMAPGDAIWGNTANPGVHVWVSGAELPLAG